VGHGLAHRELGVGDVEEVSSPEERAERVPGGDVGRRVLGVAVRHPVQKRHRAVGGHGQDPHELFQVRAVVLREPVGRGEGLLPPTAPSSRERVDTLELDRARVVVQA
jgi:hypothetical protein